MAGQRKAIELAIGEEDLAALGTIARSRTESASRVGRARMLLAYRVDPSFFAVGRAVGAHHQTVQRCVERALAFGPMAALDDRPRPGREATITAEAKAWVVNLACRKAKERMRGNCGRRGMLLHGVAFLSWNQHPEPKGSRRATPLLPFQHSSGQPPGGGRSLVQQPCAPIFPAPSSNGRYLRIPVVHCVPRHCVFARLRS